MHISKGRVELDGFDSEKGVEILEETSGPFYGELQIRKSPHISRTRLSGFLKVDIPRSYDRNFIIVDFQSKVKGYLLVDNNREISGEMFLEDIGPIWGDTHIFRSKFYTILYMDNPKLLRPFDDLFRTLYYSMPKLLRKGIIGQFARFIALYIINYRPSFQASSNLFSRLKEMREVVTKMERPKKRVKESTRKWEEVSEGIFVNKESWEHRLARYQKAREKLQEIMDECA